MRDNESRPILFTGILLGAGLLLVAGLYLTSTIRRTLDAALHGASPGKADYAIEVFNGFRLGRSSTYSRSITGPLRVKDPRDPEIKTDEWVPPDVALIGWNTRYIVCYQSPTIRSASHGWWIIDTVSEALYGPLDDQAFGSKKADLQIALGIPIYGAPSSSADLRQFESILAQTSTRPGITK